MEFWTIILLILVAALVYALVTRPKAQPVPEPQRTNVGDLTLETLRFYSGYDFTRPTLIAVRGKIYDVSDDARFAPPNGELRALAGRECARALAKGSTAEADLSDMLDDLSEQEVGALDAKLAELEASCHGPAGQVVAMQELTPEQLARHDGSDASLPLYLAIRGTVYDITKGKHFYGPDGVYPFAGKEVARAFALLSTELKDCCDDLSGLSYAEQENLREWTQRFNAKYPIVGKLVKGQEASQEQQQEQQQGQQ